MKKSISLFVSCIAFLGGQAPVMADDGFYLGGGLAYTTSKGTNTLFGLSSEDTFLSGALIAGYRKQIENNFWAAELQFEKANSSFEVATPFGSAGCSPALGPIVCDVDTVVRLRGVYGAEIAKGLEFYGTTGLVYVEGDGATSPTTQDSFSSMGLSFGIGAQRTFAKSWKVRVEINHDVASKNISDAGGALNPAGCCSHNIRQTSTQLLVIKSF